MSFLRSSIFLCFGSPIGVPSRAWPGQLVMCPTLAWIHFEALEKQYNTTRVKKKQKEIWREVEVQVPKPPSWTPENVIEDIDVVEQATNAS
ncbi:hypothetical protein Tco_0727458 [Tanacetum coccineum]|uniref:Uncharacterized protein n=1 Tax=Tanacetum coccineum TaxID=301880 RepID=A0ABQ4YKZ2_9ASTR